MTNSLFFIALFVLLEAMFCFKWLVFTLVAFDIDLKRRILNVFSFFFLVFFYLIDENECSTFKRIANILNDGKIKPFNVLFSTSEITHML